MTLSCDPSRIVLLLEDRLTRAEERALEEHLETCEACRRRLSANAADEKSWSEIQDYLRDEPGDWESPNEQLGKNSKWSRTADEHPFDSADVEAMLERLAPTDDPAMLGRLGQYEIVGVVGVGGMGVVLKGYEKALHRYVAIKVLAPHLAHSGAARRRFAREAQAAAAVVHDNVIEIYGVAENLGLQYLAMPYFAGASLQKRIEESGPLETAEILRIGLQVASGLAAAHAQGLVHRDIKPANILLTDGVARVKITDFGLARAADDVSLTRTGVIAGTPQYMSPEQARGEPIDHRSDLFSMGSVLYAMCTGRAPFRAETSLGVLRKITDAEPTAVWHLNPSIPAWLWRLIRRMLAKSPPDRFQTAAEVAELLGSCLAHLQRPGVHSLPECLAEDEPRMKNTAGRLYAVLAAVAMLSIPLVVYFSGFLFEPHNDGDARESPIAIIATAPEGVDALEKLVIEAMKANRSQFPQRGALYWTRRKTEKRLEGRELRGAFELWWDGTRVATRSTEEGVVVDPKGASDVSVLGLRTSFDGKEFHTAENRQEANVIAHRELEFRPNENWLDLIGWTKSASFETYRDRENLKSHWERTTKNGRKCAVWTSTAEDGGSVREVFDLERGGELVALEWKNSSGIVYMKQDRELAQLAGGTWIPTRVVATSIDQNTGDALLRQEDVINILACSFGENADLPEKIFELPSQQILQLPPAEKDVDTNQSHNPVHLQFTDEGGRAIAGVKVGSSVSISDEAEQWNYSRLSPRGYAYSDETGAVLMAMEDLLPADEQFRSNTLLYALEPTRKLGALVEISRGDEGRTVECVLAPCSTVRGTLDVGLLSNRSNATFQILAFHKGRRFLTMKTQKDHFELLLPPDEYTLELYAFSRGSADDTHASAVHTPRITRELAVVSGEAATPLPRAVFQDSRLSSLIGQPAPQLEGLTSWLDGEERRLDNFRGKVVLLHFWSMGCLRCIEEMPQIIDVHEEFKDRGLVILSIHPSYLSAEELREQVESLSSRVWNNKDISFPIAIDGDKFSEFVAGATAVDYGVQGWPAMLLVDRHGILVKVVDVLSSDLHAEVLQLLDAN